MIGILVVCHGDLAEGLLDSMRLIVGKQERTGAIGLYESDSIDEFPKKIKEKVEELIGDEGLIIFVDIIGASPFNACARVIHENPELKLSLITGVNLPMLLETALNYDQGLSLEELTLKIRDIGREQIKTLSEIIK